MSGSSVNRTFTLSEAYLHLVAALRTFRYLFIAQRKGNLDGAFVERIMLAVTEVNGCAICSYVHARIALEQGLDKQEIADLLAGDSGGVPESQGPAILFAQHYAQSNGKPAKETWDRIIKEYGERTSLGILSAVCKIMVGNIYGGASSSIIARIRRKSTDTEKSMLHEVVLLCSMPLFFLVALVHTASLLVLKRPLEVGI